MKTLTGLGKLFITGAILLGVTAVKAEEVKIIDENIQSWKAITSYGNGEQNIPTENGEGIVELQQVTIVKSKLPDNIDNPGPCSAGYIQMTNNRTPGSAIKLPSISNGISKIELNIVTSSTATRTVDILAEEDPSFKVTLSGLNKTGNTYTALIGTSGSTTLIISNVTGGPIYITDIKVYQDKTPGDASTDATLRSLSYQINDKTISIPDFSPNKTAYDIQLSGESNSLPVVSASGNQKDATVSVAQVKSLPGSAIVTVTASDNITSRSYTVHFFVSEKTSATASLPLNASGTSTQDPLQNIQGFSGNNLGAVPSDGGVKFEGSKASSDNKPTLVLAYDNSADKLSFDVKGSNAGSPLGFENIQFILEESSNGVDFSMLADLSEEISVSTKYKNLSDYSISAESRYLRWTFKNATKGNISINNIILTNVGTSVKFGKTEEVGAFLQHGVLYVSGAENKQIEIYDPVGRKIKNIPGKFGINEIALSGHQFIIVKIEDRTFKLSSKE